MPATRGGMTAERVISSRKPSASGLRALMRPERGKASVAPAHTCSELFRGEGFSPLREDTREVLVAVDRGICRTQSAQAFSIAPAVVGDAGGGVELDRLERPHECPAQAQTVFQGFIEILRRHVAVPDQAKRL